MTAHDQGKPHFQRIALIGIGLIGSSLARGIRRHGLVVALTSHENSGDDRSYLVLDTGDQLSRGTVKSLLTETGFAVLDVQTWNDGPDRRLHLIEVEGCVSDNDPRLAPLAASDESEGGTLRVIGGYAVPLTAEQLAAGGQAGSSLSGVGA